MEIVLEERKLANGSNQFNLVDENNLLIGVVTGFSNDVNLKNATLFAKSPKMLKVLREIMKTYNEKGQLLNFDVNLVREIIAEIES